MNISKKKKYLLVFTVLLAVIIFANSNRIFYCLQIVRLHKFNPVILSAQKGFAPDIFGNTVPKIWPHRVNSVPRLRFLLNDFNGFECDIFYKADSNYFDVGHETERSIGLSLEKYFQLPGTSLKYFWLDLKNLDEANADKVATLLLHLDSLYSIRRRIIVESTSPLPLKKIAANGFFTSYYIPAFEPAVFADNTAYIAAVKKGLDPAIPAISQSSDNMDRVTAALPGKTKLSWNFSRLATVGNRQPIETMYNREDIKVILVEIPNIYYR